MPKGPIKVEYINNYDSWKAEGPGYTPTYKDTKKEALSAAKALGSRYGTDVKVYTRKGKHQRTINNSSSESSSSSSGGGLGDMLGF